MMKMYAAIRSNELDVHTEGLYYEMKKNRQLGYH